VQVGTQQGQQRAVTLGKIRARSAVEDQPDDPPWLGDLARCLGQGHNQLMF